MPVSDPFARKPDEQLNPNESANGDNFTVSEVDEFQNAVDHGIAQGDGGVDETDRDAIHQHLGQVHQCISKQADAIVSLGLRIYCRTAQKECQEQTLRLRVCAPVPKTKIVICPSGRNISRKSSCSKDSVACRLAKGPPAFSGRGGRGSISGCDYSGGAISRSGRWCYRSTWLGQQR